MPLARCRSRQYHPGTRARWQTCRTPVKIDENAHPLFFKTTITNKVYTSHHATSHHTTSRHITSHHTTPHHIPSQQQRARTPARQQRSMEDEQRSRAPPRRELDAGLPLPRALVAAGARRQKTTASARAGEREATHATRRLARVLAKPPLVVCGANPARSARTTQIQIHKRIQNIRVARGKPAASC